MSFALYALLDPEYPNISLEALKRELDRHFGWNKRFSSRLVSNPLTKQQSIKLEWGQWSVTLTPEQGEYVREESAEIKKRLGTKAPPGLESLDRRIYAFFADDPDRLFTTPAVDVMQYLQEIKGAIVFDINQNDILKARSSDL